MKILPFTIPKSKNDAILFQEDHQWAFYDHLHRHEEIQISYIARGNGTLFLGDVFIPFESGNMFVIGANVPHVFKTETNPKAPSLMHTIFFKKDAFGTSFFDTEELSDLGSFFIKTKTGIILKNPSKKLYATFKRVKKETHVDRFLTFIKLLKIIDAQSSLNENIAIENKKYSAIDGSRMDAVLQHTLTHFREAIAIKTIAAIAAMTPNAFCTYFKKRTRKTYTAFLNEIRIEEACKLLKLENELSIATIAENSGFKNISHFNRTFKAFKNTTPLQYKKSLKTNV